MSDYQKEYFEEKIFESDYQAIANAILKSYQPKTVIEFGCGPGHLTRELSKLNIAVDAIDGFSEPDFSDFANITFNKVDINDEASVANFLNKRQYDMAICTEVAEHLEPESSTHLIKYLTSCAPVVIFSAAVPEQNGHGHINCQTRGFWHNLFVKHKFQLADTLRKNLRANEDLAIWYRLNLLDYVSNNIPIDLNTTMQNLIESESYSSSFFYQKNNENFKNQAYLNYPLVRHYFKLRNFLKSFIK